MRNGLLFAPFAWVCRTFGKSACTFAVVVIVAATGQGAAILLRDSYTPAVSPVRPVAAVQEPGLRQPGQRGIQDLPRRADRGLPEDSFDVEFADEFGR